MKKLLLVLTLILLLVVGGAAALIIIDPVGISTLAGFGPQEADEAPARPAIAAGSNTPANQTAEASGERRPPRRPPARQEAGAEQQPAVETTGASSLARKGRYIGPAEQLPAGRPPRVELYPLTVVRSTYPSPGTITVELVLANRSGQHWKNAYVALRSAGGSTAQMFEIADWGIDEIVGLDYTFPKSEVNERLRELRVVNVSGELRESALADLLSRSRQHYVEALSPQDAARRDTGGGSLMAPGLLGLFGSFQSPYTGVGVTMIEPRQPNVAPLQIRIPEVYLLPTAPLATPSDSMPEKARRAAEAAASFSKAGQQVQLDLEAFVASLAAAPYQDAMPAGGTAALAKLRESIKQFNARGIELSAQVQAARDPEVRKLNLAPALTEYSRRIVNQLQYVEQEIQAVEPGFRIQEK